MSSPTRRRVLQAGATVGALGLAGCQDLMNGDDGLAYEIWAADQGTNTIYVYEPDDHEEPTFGLIDEIDTEAEGGEVPHMIDFSSDYAYAAIACTAGSRTLVYRTDDRELVGNVETGAGSHFAGFAPDDEYIHVDVIGEEEIVRIDADLDNESFEIVDSINVREDETILEAGITSGAPICHQYDQNGRSFHTLGPAFGDGALVIVDHDSFEVDTAFSGQIISSNCGTMPHPEENKFYLTGGMPSDPDGNPPDPGIGQYYVVDADEDQIIGGGDTGGVDAHGFWYTTDGEELWVLNRETNDGVIIDPDTDEVVEEIPAFGPEDGEEPENRDAPDIMWSSPDGQYMFVTLRGPEPVSGDPHAATGVNPGFSVLDVDSREILDVVQPDPENSESDFHGIGVRPVDDPGDAITSPPF